MESHIHRRSDFSGEQFGHYRLIERIGCGGFAEVYLAQHIHLGTLAVVKVLGDDLTSENARKFLREARIAVLLKHPHIIRILDFGTHFGIPYIAMEYAANGSLRKLYPPGTRLSLPAILELLQPMADALEHIHAKGYVHQDIKLDNMLLDENGRTLLSDFGLATSVQNTLLAEEFACTLTHAAPERFSENYTPSPSVDIYAMGIVVYELLVGYPPFQGDAIAWQHKYKQPVPLRNFLPDIPVQVERVVLKSLEKLPEDRYETVGELFIALHDAYEQSGDSYIGTLRSTGDPNSDENERPIRNGNEDPLDTAFALESYLLFSTLPAALAYLLDANIGSVWRIFALSVLIIPITCALARPNRLAKILVLLTFLASSLIGFVAQNLLLAGMVQFMALACCTFSIFLYCLFHTSK